MRLPLLLATLAVISLCSFKAAAEDRPVRGSITYTGTYSGERATESRKGSSMKELEGSITITAYFDGSALRVSYRGTGLLRPGRMSGLLQDDLCKAYSEKPEGSMIGECRQDTFNGALTLSQGRTQQKIEFQTKASKVVDAAEVERLRQEQSERRQAEAHAAKQLPVPDLSPLSSPAKPSKTLSVKLQNIDDVGYVLIGRPDGSWSTAAWAEWASGVPGTASASLTSLLGTGENFVVIGVHNKAFAFGPGRWSFDFDLTTDAGSIWTRSGGTPGGGVGTRYWKPFLVAKRKDGMLIIETATANQVALIYSRMKRFNEEIIKEFGTETSVLGAALNGLAKSMLSAPPTSGSNAGCDDECQFFLKREENAREWANKQPGRRAEDYPEIQ